MNKQKFIKLYGKAMNGEISFNEEEVDEILKLSLNCCSSDIKITVAIQELAELIQVLTKFIIGEGDRVKLLEKLADIEIGLEFISQIYGISEKELAAAVTAKLYREKERRLKELEESNS